MRTFEEICNYTVGDIDWKTEYDATLKTNKPLAESNEMFMKIYDLLQKNQK